MILHGDGLILPKAISQHVPTLLKSIIITITIIATTIIATTIITITIIIKVLILID